MKNDEMNVKYYDFDKLKICLGEKYKDFYDQKIEGPICYEGSFEIKMSKNQWRKFYELEGLTMKKNKNIKTIIEKLNEEQLREFVDGLTEDQIYTLFESRAWTYDELRSLFADMEEDDSKRFFGYLNSQQLNFLLEMMMDEEKS